MLERCNKRKLMMFNVKLKDQALDFYISFDFVFIFTYHLPEKGTRLIFLQKLLDSFIDINITRNTNLYY